MGAVSGWMLVNESEKMVTRMRSRRDGPTCFTTRQTKGSVGRWAGRIARVGGRDWFRPLSSLVFLIFTSHASTVEREIHFPSSSTVIAMFLLLISVLLSSYPESAWLGKTVTSSVYFNLRKKLLLSQAHTFWDAGVFEHLPAPNCLMNIQGARTRHRASF